MKNNEFYDSWEIIRKKGMFKYVAETTILVFFAILVADIIFWIVNRPIEFRTKISMPIFLVFATLATYSSKTASWLTSEKKFKETRIK